MTPTMTDPDAHVLDTFDQVIDERLRDSPTMAVLFLRLVQLNAEALKDMADAGLLDEADTAEFKSAFSAANAIKDIIQGNRFPIDAGERVDEFAGKLFDLYSEWIDSPNRWSGDELDDSTRQKFRQIADDALDRIEWTTFALGRPIPTE